MAGKKQEAVDSVVFTEKHFKLFKESVEKWLSFWGLSDWEVVVTHDTSEEMVYARIIWNTAGRAANIAVNDRWDTTPTDYEIDKTAFHEVCELLISKLADLAALGASADNIAEASHIIIRRLENCVFNPLYNKK